MKRRLAVLALVGSLFFVFHGGCSDSPDSRPLTAGAGGLGGASASGQGGEAGVSPLGAGGTAGGSGIGGSSGKGGKGGNSGKGGASGQAGSPSKLEWKEIGTVRDSPIGQLVEPEKHKLFDWGPCDWTPDPSCEEASFEDGIGPLQKYGGIITRVHDDGEKVRVGIVVTRAEVAAVTDETGKVLAAFTNFSDGNLNRLEIVSVYKDSFGINVYKKSSAASGGILGKLGQTPVLFDPKFPQPYLYASPAQEALLNSKRWAWWLGQSAMVSWDALSGPPVSVFSVAIDETLFLWNIVATNDAFVYAEGRAEGDHAKTVLLVGDGIEKGKPFLPELPDSENNSPMFADTHLAWFHGEGYLGPARYEKVALWASKPPTPDMLDVQPFKVIDLSLQQINYSSYFLKGGQGWVAFGGGGEFGDNTGISSHVRLVHIESAKTKLVELPEGLYCKTINGITREHVWFSVGQTYPPRRLVRWKLPDPTSLP